MYNLFIIGMLRTFILSHQGTGKTFSNVDCKPIKGEYEQSIRRN